MNFSTGNSWDPKIVEHCVICGVGKLCMICHRHAQERGKCTDCEPYPREKKQPVASVSR